MTSVLPIDSVRQSQLFARLRNLPDPAVEALVGNLPDLCKEASDRMKAVLVFHPQFTLHDATHLLRVTELMGKVLGATLDTLNAVEIALLILAAHFHDQGMVPDAEELQAIQKTDEFRLHRDTWAVEHPNLGEIERQLAQRNLAKEERLRLALRLAELDSARLGDYLRLTHGQRSARLVRQLYCRDSRLKVAGISLADPLARLCESHVLSAYDLTPERLAHDELIGTSPVNLRYLALILRVADILDFDRERTPDGLFRTLHFTSEVSLAEWEKHRAVRGWMIRPDLIRFEMRFESPVYERTARQFLDWIDDELSAASEIVRSFPQEVACYKLDLPLKVDRSRIGPKGDAYVYHDLEFSLSRDEIVKLLMTEELYGEPSLCVRELLQNSLDALRYRKALSASAGFDWTAGRVDMEHGVDEHGHEFLRCTDNGVGMDEGVITRFLTRAGRSYYRSPEFEQERIRFRAAGTDFHPCSQFGIGFMSCFMLGDRVLIETRRDYGPGRDHGVPWVVEINGLGGMLTLKKGRADLPVGTTVAITSRPKPAFMDREEDQVQLISTLDKYALAVEYMIHARCTIPEIAANLDLGAGIRPIKTFLEEAGVQQVIRFEQELSEVDPHLHGVVSESFLVDGAGVATLANKEARWRKSKGRTPLSLKMKSDSLFIRDDWDLLPEVPGTICMDGILVSSDYQGSLTGLKGGPALILDLRGFRKPVITAARTVPDNYYERVDWRWILRQIALAEGRLWVKFLESPYVPNPEKLWDLLQVHSCKIATLPSHVIWERLLVPVIGKAGGAEWRLVKSLGSLRFSTVSNNFYPGFIPFKLFTTTGKTIGEKSRPLTFRDFTFGRTFQDNIDSAIIGLATATIEAGELTFLLQEPVKVNETPCERWIGKQVLAMAFSGQLAPALGVFSGEKKIFNRQNRLIEVAEHSQFQLKRTELEQFAHQLLDISLKEEMEEPSRDLKYLAHLYLAVDWALHHQSLRPPYLFWGEEEGWVEITDADFRRWAGAKG